MRFLFFLFLFISVKVVSQISSSQQKALNNYILYADHSAEEISSIVSSVVEYYPSIQQQKKNKNSFFKDYRCPVQLQEYYYKTALAESKALSTLATSLTQKLNALKEIAEKIDANCKALDTYYKLEDYKVDNFLGAEELIDKFPDLFRNYKSAQAALVKEAAIVYKKYSPGATANVNDKAIALMRQQMEHEKAFLDRWTYNLQEDIPTGWPNDDLAASILVTDKFVKDAKQTKLTIKYPASSMFSSFNEGMESILESKRLALDGYNAEAKKSDHHGNEAYLDLINYYNGVLISFYNSFIDYAQQEGYYGLKAVRYLPVFEIRNKAKEEHFQVKHFQDVPYVDLKIVSQTTPIPVNASTALNNYVDFINECLRQSRFLQTVVGNLSSSAAYYKGLTSFQGKGGLHYDYADYKVPLSLYQKAVTDSNGLPVLYAKNINLQMEVMLSMMKEMEQLSEELSHEANEKRYEQDQLNHIYEILERYKFLFETLDTKKEILFDDVRKVYDSYPLKNPQSNWIISWKALRLLVDDDHDALFNAKAFYKGKAKSVPQTKAIDDQLREVIAKEYDNMKGIEKYGRYNGLCPYTPYEDIPKTSRTLSEKLQKVGEAKSYNNRHPYQDLVYLYNEIVDDYNKFCELSKLGLLKGIHQPEWFEIRQGDAPATTSAHQTEVQRAPVIAVAAQQTSTSQVDNTGNKNVQVKTQVVHDTVYIEKRDTVYLADPNENLHSMEGYATNNMVLLLDVSGSMNSADRLPLLKTSVLNLLDMMRKEDQVSIVVYSGRAKVLLPPTSFTEKDKVKKAIDALTSSGQTDGNAGIKLAYQVVDKNYIRGGNNRIILATDGEFPISEEVFSMADKFSKEDISITVFNFGKTTASAKNLEKLSKKGRGNYEHITKENVEFKLIREAQARKKR